MNPRDEVAIYSAPHERSEKIFVQITDAKGVTKEYSTYIDINGTQRFPIDPLYNSMCKCGLDLNRLVEAYRANEFTQWDLLELYMGMGVSVCLLEDVSAFADITISNPMWDIPISNPMWD